MTKIEGNYEKRTVQLQSHNSKTKEEKSTKGSNSIYGGDLMLGQDEIARKQAIAGKDALKQIMDVFKKTCSVDKDLQRCQEEIDNCYEEIKDREGKLADLEEREKKLLENEYEVEDEQELSPEQREKYNKQLKEFSDQRKELKKDIGQFKQMQADNRMSIDAVHKNRLKRHDMLDAQKEAESILEAAGREAINGMVSDAVEKQDEIIEEMKENAEAQQVQETEQSILKAHADKMVIEKKITKEDLKGITYNETV